MEARQQHFGVERLGFRETLSRDGDCSRGQDRRGGAHRARSVLRRRDRRSREPELRRTPARLERLDRPASRAGRPLHGRRRRYPGGRVRPADRPAGGGAERRAQLPRPLDLGRRAPDRPRPDEGDPRRSGWRDGRGSGSGSSCSGPTATWSSKTASSPTARSASSGSRLPSGRRSGLTRPASSSPATASKGTSSAARGSGSRSRAGCSARGARSTTACGGTGMRRRFRPTCGRCPGVPANPLCGPATD